MDKYHDEDVITDDQLYSQKIDDSRTNRTVRAYLSKMN